MREIKFRGKRKDNGEWAYGYYCYGSRAYDGHIQHEILQTNVAGCYGREVIPETVGQFTGLKDKNNKGDDLYAGDVVYIAGYGDYICEFPFLELYDALPEGDVEDKKGNIHDNPEQLT